MGLEKYEDELQIIENAFVDVNSRLGCLYDALETGKISLDDLSPRICELREQQDKLRARREELCMLLVGQRAEVATREEVAACVADLKNLLDESTFIEKKSFFRSFVNQIEGTDSEVSLNYTIPILLSEIREEKVPVLGIVHYGGRYKT